MRDFYSAYYTLNRYQYLQNDPSFEFIDTKKSLKKFMIFSESVILLMKRKFKEVLKIIFLKLFIEFKLIFFY
jgi:hypothetical protein